MFASKQIIKIIQVVYDGVEGITAPTRLKDGRIHWEVFGTTPARRQDGKIPWEVFGRLAGVWSRTFHGILPYCRIAGGVVIGSGCGQILSIESCRLAVLPGCGQRYNPAGDDICDSLCGRQRRHQLLTAGPVTTHATPFVDDKRGTRC